MRLKSLIFFALVILGMVLLGWISFQKSDTDANIKINTQEIKEDTSKVIEEGRELIHEAEDALDKSKK